MEGKDFKVLLQEYSRLNYRYKRTITQDFLTFAILMTIFSLNVFIVLASAFFDLDAEVISLTKEIILIVSSNLATAIGVVFGLKDKGCDCNAE